MMIASQWISHSIYIKFFDSTIMIYAHHAFPGHSSQPPSKQKVSFAPQIHMIQTPLMPLKIVGDIRSQTVVSSMTNISTKRKSFLNTFPQKIASFLRNHQNNHLSLYCFAKSYTDTDTFGVVADFRLRYPQFKEYKYLADLSTIANHSKLAASLKDS